MWEELTDRIQGGFAAVREIVGKVWPYIALGSLLAFMMSVMAGQGNALMSLPCYDGTS